MNLTKSLLASIFLTTLAACHQPADPIDEVAALYSNRQVIPNIEYSRIDSTSLYLDAYIPAKQLGEPPWNEYSTDRKPTLLYLHGGGWQSGDKISRSLFLMPYISKGWCVLTADYRLLGKTSLPRIIGDARAALNWIYDNAEKYKFDTTKIIVAGESAGGHLALMAGLLNTDAPFESGGRKINRKIKVAGIINWFGVADLNLAAKGWDTSFIRLATSNSSNPDSLLRLCSPTTYIDSSSPPVFTIHGDQDKIVNYVQAPLLRDKLNHYGVKNELFTVANKKHGNFDPDEMTDVYRQLWKFLDGIGIK